MSKPKCEEIEFEHYWEDLTVNTYTVLTSSTPQVIYPPKTRRCVNCGLKQTLWTKQPLIQEWVNDLKPSDQEANSRQAKSPKAGTSEVKG